MVASLDLVGGSDGVRPRDRPAAGRACLVGRPQPGGRGALHRVSRTAAGGGSPVEGARARRLIPVGSRSRARMCSMREPGCRFARSACN